jgi:thymidylate synthase ThyX
MPDITETKHIKIFRYAKPTLFAMVDDKNSTELKDLIIEKIGLVWDRWDTMSGGEVKDLYNDPSRVNKILDWKNHEPVDSKDTHVFALHGADPEVQAYAMAKYSRSALSMKESIAEISSQKASDFLNTFYFEYGHKSIADLAHVPMALENISLLAAIEVVDEPKWDGQERSTRYQDFSKPEYYVPHDMNEVESAHYHATMKMLFDAYNEVFEAAKDHFCEEQPKPEGMNRAAYDRTIRARAFDVARYLLPLGTLTSVGQITSARTLEEQICRMLSSPYAEVQILAEKLKAAAVSPAHNVQESKIQELLDSVSGHLTPEESRKLHEGLIRPVAVAPTLVKYTNENMFILGTETIAKDIISKLELGTEAEIEDGVTASLPKVDSLELEILATILYQYSHTSFLTLIKKLGQRGEHFIAESFRSLLSARGPHDDLLRSYRAASGVVFDITMDIGGYRDMHRHRRSVQISQAYTPEHGFSLPEPICTDSIREIYLATTKKAAQAFQVMRILREMRGVPAGPESYLLPLGTRHRFLMKMDVAELAYISELRTKPAGHISYRRIAWEMYRHLIDIAPTLASAIRDRVTRPDDLLDFFKR